MRKYLKRFSIIGLMFAACVGVSAPAGAAILAREDVFLIQKLGNRLRVVLNDQLLFKKIKIENLRPGQYGWRFVVDANRFLANDQGKKKAVVAFGPNSQLRGVHFKVRTKPNGIVKSIAFTVRAKVFERPGRRLLTDYVLRANDPQYDAGLIFMRVVSPS